MPVPAIVHRMLMASHLPNNNTSRGDNQPRLVSVVAIDGRDESAVLAFAASLARGFTKPIATAILESAREHGVHVRDVEGFAETTGAGVIASVDGHTVVLGNVALFADLGLSVDNVGEWPERLRRRGEHVLFLAVDGRTAGCVGIVDSRV